MQSSIKSIWVLGLVLTLAACQDQDYTPDDQANKTIITNYSKQSLNARVRIPQYEEMMSFYDVPVSTSNSRVSQQFESSEETYAFVLRAEVDAPTFEDQTLRATHVKIDGNRAFVSYNTEGEIYLGGVDLFDISDIQAPVLLAQVMVDGADFSAVTYANNKIYLAGAQSLAKNDTLGSPAIVEILEVENDQIVGDPVLIDVPGFTATDVKVNGNMLYVTSGSNAGLYIYDLNTLELKSSQKYDDARSLAFDDDKFVVMQGTPARVTTHNSADAAMLNSFNVGGAEIPESKSIVDMSDELIYVPAGRSGLKVIDGASGETKISVSLPEMEDTDPEMIVTNGISVNDDKVFIANGAAGLYVGEQKANNMGVLGSISFNASVNYVESQENVMFVATGAGGLKILEIVKYDPEKGDYLDIGDWDDNGKPEYICESASSIEEELTNKILNQFKATENIINKRPEWFTANAITELILKEDTDLTLTFFHEGAGHKNTLGYYTYETANMPASPAEVNDFTVLYPNVTYKKQGGPLERGDKLCLQGFKAGSTIGFFMNVNSFKNGEVTKGVYTHHSTLSFNTKHPEGLKQNNLVVYDATSGTIILTFEDIKRPGGDKDFEDAVYLIKLSNPDAVDTSSLSQL